MTIEHSRPRCMAFQEESTFASSSLNWDQDVQAGTAFNQAVIEPNVEGLQQTKVPNENSVKRAGAKQVGILGLKSDSTVSFNTYLHGNPANSADAAIATHFPLSLLAKNAMGGALLSTRQGITAGSTTTAVVMDAVTGIEIGMFGFFADASNSNKGDIRQITGIDGVTLTVRPGLSFTPASGDVMHACVSAYLDWDSLTDHTDANHTTLGMFIKGEDNEDSYQMRGVKLAMEINALEQGALSMATWEGGVVSFDNSVESVAVPALTGTVAGSAPLVIGTGDDISFYFGAKSGTLAETDVFSVEPAIGITHNQVRGPNGTEGTHHYNVADAPGESGLNISLFYSSSFAEDFEASNEKEALIQIGTTTTHPKI